MLPLLLMEGVIANMHRKHWANKILRLASLQDRSLNAMFGQVSNFSPTERLKLSRMIMVSSFVLSKCKMLYQDTHGIKNYRD